MHQERLPLKPARSSPVPGRGAAPIGCTRTYRGESDYWACCRISIAQPFAPEAGAANAFLDVIVRRESPADRFAGAVPVGVVSPRYALLTHPQAGRRWCGPRWRLSERTHARCRPKPTSGLRRAHGALLRAPSPGGRLRSGDGHPLALQLLCLNSVDGSSTLRMLLGWYRFVCANGLAVGTTRAEWRLVHREGMEPTDVRGRWRVASKLPSASALRSRLGGHSRCRYSAS